MRIFMNNVIHPQFAKRETKSHYKMAKKKDRGEILLYGNIGDSFWTEGISAKKFQDDLKSMGSIKDLDIRINSEGGDVFDGKAIYNLLVSHSAKKTVYVDGIAASIASLIAMAGDEIIMGDGSFIMIHNPWGGAIGDARKMRSMATLLDQVKDTVVNTYAARTNNSKANIAQWMDDETWMNAKESQKKGFATEISENIKVAASVSMPEMYTNLPSELRPNRIKAAKTIAKVASFIKSAR